MLKSEMEQFKTRNQVKCKTLNPQSTALNKVQIPQVTKPMI